jgi:Zn-dependent protease with chaperone function
VSRRLQLGLGAAGLAGALLALVLAVSTVRVAPAAAHRLGVAGLDFTYPALNAAAVMLFAFAALGAAVVVVAAGRAGRELKAHRRLLRALPLAGALPGEPSVTLIRATEPMAFCAGWLRPRVYLSTAALERLADAELEVVLAHERHHRARRDPLRLALGRVLCEALFFLPVLRALHARAGEVAELDADAAALVAAGGRAAPLASAMLALSVSPGVGISPGRVDSLLGRPPAWRLPWPLLVAGLATLAATLVLLWRASAGASVAATLNLPIASSAPCVLVLALVPVVACLVATISRHGYDIM